MRKRRNFGAAGLIAAFCIISCVWMGCSEAKSDPRAEAPPNPNPAIEHTGDTNSFKVDDPSRFPVVRATEYDAAPELNVTGTVAPDISRNVPVISLAAGRVVSINARLGDFVNKGQVLLRVQSADIANALSDYRQAVADETLYFDGAVPATAAHLKKSGRTRGTEHLFQLESAPEDWHEAFQLRRRKHIGILDIRQSTIRIPGCIRLEI